MFDDLIRSSIIVSMERASSSGIVPPRRALRIHNPLRWSVSRWAVRARSSSPHASRSAKFDGAFRGRDRFSAPRRYAQQAGLGGGQQAGSEAAMPDISREQSTVGGTASDSPVMRGRNARENGHG